MKAPRFHATRFGSSTRRGCQQGLEPMRCDSSYYPCSVVGPLPTLPSGSAWFLQGCKALYPPTASNSIEIKGSQVGCLDDGEFLNDTVIDIYIRFFPILLHCCTTLCRDKTALQGQMCRCCPYFVYSRFSVILAQRLLKPLLLLQKYQAMPEDLSDMPTSKWPQQQGCLDLPPDELRPLEQRRFHPCRRCSTAYFPPQQSGISPPLSTQ